jgi:hypothetical protein
MRLFLFSMFVILMASCTTAKQTCCKTPEKTTKNCEKVEKDKCCDKHK